VLAQPGELEDAVQEGRPAHDDQVAAVLLGACLRAHDQPERHRVQEVELPEVEHDRRPLLALDRDERVVELRGLVEVEVSPDGEVDLDAVVPAGDREVLHPWVVPYPGAG
jgi:hypothetical protein